MKINDHHKRGRGRHARFAHWLAAAAVGLSLGGCGDVEEPAELEPQGDLEGVTQPFIVWDTAASLPINRVKMSIRICLGGYALAPYQTQVQTYARAAILAWVDQMRPVSTVPLLTTSGITFGCDNNPNVWINVWTPVPPIRAHVIGAIMNLYTDDFAPPYDPQEVITHEFGHIFALGDTYQEGSYACQTGQPDSIMCGTSNVFQPDDINGIREAYCKVFPGTCRRRWQPASPLNFCTGSGAEVLVGDFNGDQRSDLLCHNVNTGTKTTLLANSAGRFANPPSWSYSGNWCGGAGSQLRIGDFNGDGRSDMLCHTASNGETFVVLATASGTFNVATTWHAVLGFCTGANKQVHVGKFNSDNRSDMLCHDITTGSKAVTVASATGTFGSTSVPSASFCAGAGNQLHIGSFNASDARDDMLCHTVSDGAKSVALANADGSFTTAPPESPVFCPGSGLILRIGDFDGDGRSDMLCHELANGRKSISFANQSGQFPGLSRYWAMQWCEDAGAQLQVGNFDGVVGGASTSDMLCHRTTDGLLKLAYQQP